MTFHIRRTRSFYNVNFNNCNTCCFTDSLNSKMIAFTFFKKMLLYKVNNEKLLLTDISDVTPVQMGNVTSHGRI